MRFASPQVLWLLLILVGPLVIFLWRAWINGVGAAEISGAVKIIGQYRRPLRQWQGEVR